MNNYIPKRNLLMSFCSVKNFFWLIFCTCLLGSFPIGAAEFVLNSKADIADLLVGDGKCETSTGVCTFRAAIEESNALVGADTIFIVNQNTATDNYKLGITDLRITDDLTIKAVGPKDENEIYTTVPNYRVVISGEEKYGILIQQAFTSQATGPVVLIENLVVRSGKPDTLGSLIRSTKSFTTLSNVVIQNGGVGSRAVYNDAGSLEIKDSVLAGHASALQSDKGSLRLDNVRIENNNWAGEVGGAAVYLTDVSSFIVRESTFKNNKLLTLELDGGAIYAIGSNLTIDSTIFEDNTSLAAGGAIFTTSSSLRIANQSSFFQNVSTGSGGAIYAELVDENNPVIIEDTTFLENRAIANGGGLFISAETVSDSVSFSMQSVNISKNNSGLGAAYLDNLNSSIVNSTVSENISTKSGAGIYFTSGESILQFLTIADNDSDSKDGGNIFNISADLSLQNSIVSNAVMSGNCSGTIISLGNNIDSEDSCMFDHADDLLNTDPLFNIDENTETKTFELTENSPAIDVAICIPEIIVDQIYNTRADNCDIGALEYESSRISAGNISFVQSTYTVNEADGTVEVSLRRSSGSEGAVAVIVRDIGFGNAKADVTVEQDQGDYVSFGEVVLTWADGDFENKSFNISLIDNTEPDGDKEIFLELIHPGSGIALGSVATATISITDEEYISRVRFARSSYEFNEDDGTVVLTLVRAFAPTKEVEIDIKIVPVANDITGAEYSADYIFPNGRLFTAKFGVGEMSTNIEFSLIDDILFELTENFRVTLENGFNAEVIADESEISISILDNDAPIQTGEFSFVTRVFKVNEFDKSLEIFIERSNGSDGIVKMGVEVTGGEERALSDYVTFPSVIEFGHREKQKILRLNIIDNNIFEKNLRLKFTLKLLKEKIDARVVGRTVTVEIVDNDVARFRGGVTEETRSVGAIYLLPTLFILLLFSRVLVRNLTRTSGKYFFKI